MLKQVFALFVWLVPIAGVLAQSGPSSGREGPTSAFSLVVGRPTDSEVTLSVLSTSTFDAFVEYGATLGSFTSRTPARTVTAGTPADFVIEHLSPSTAYFYRVQTKPQGVSQFATRDTGSFRTQRRRGETFSFGVQGDSHPERLGRMYDPDLYVQALNNVAKDHPDFFFMMGDDFSIERLIERGNKSQDAVNAIYAHQRSFLGLVGKSTPLMLVNGNHEQAAKYLLDGTATNFAVLAGKARTAFFPLPAPGGIYSGNAEPVEHIGLLRDYYSWEWGDALFVVIDPYWHSDVAVDNEAGTKAPLRDGDRGAVGYREEAAIVTRSVGQGEMTRGPIHPWERCPRVDRARVAVTSGRSRSGTHSTSGFVPRCTRARPRSSSCSAITSRAQAAVVSRSRRFTNGAVRIVVAAGGIVTLLILRTKSPRSAGSTASSRPARLGRSRSISSCATPA